MSDLQRGWTTATIGDLVSHNGVFTDGDWVESKDQDTDGDVRLTQLADIGEGLFRDRSNRFLTSTAACRLRCTYLLPGDILVARMPDPLGRACIFPGDSQPCVTVVDVCIVRPGTNSVSPRWLMWWINTPQFRTQILARQAGTTRKRISRKNLAAIEFPIPPELEQARIAAAIDEQFSRLDAGVATLERIQQNLVRTRAAVLQAAISGRLADTITPGTTASAQEWDTVTVGDIADVSGGITKNPKRRPQRNAVPFLRVANVQRDTLNLNEIHEIELFDGELEKCRLRRGDLLVVEGNGSPDQIGRSAIWDGSIDPCVHQNHLIRVRPGAQVLPAYLNLFWNAPSTIATIRAVASSTSGLYTLSTGKVRSIPVVLPPLAIQGQIVTEVERQLSFVDALGGELVKAFHLSRALRSSILSAAFSGRLTAQDPNDEPASVLLERIAADRVSSNCDKPVKAHRQRRA